MVRCSTVYDKSINKKVFLIRGDESYTSTTTTVLELVNLNTAQYQYITAVFKVNVLRDKGASTIGLYDNDILLESKSWDSTMSEITFTCNLNWEVEHNIHARYMGNNQCLASYSQKILVNEINTNTYETTITANPSKSFYNMNESITIAGRLDCVQDSGTVQDQIIKFYFDGVEIGTATTEVNGTYSHQFKFEDYGFEDHVGNTQVDVVFEGHDRIRKSYTSCTLHIGYALGFMKCPDVIFTYQENLIQLKLSKEGSTDVAGKTVELYVQPLHSSPFTGVTDSNGIVNFNNVGLNPSTLPYELTDLFILAVYEEDGVDYEVELTDRKAYNPTTFSLNTDKTIISPNTLANISATFPDNIKGIPVTFVKGYGTTYDEEDILAMVTTDNNGVASFNYQGTGEGTVNITAIAGGWQSITLEDVLQYWSVIGNVELSKNSGTYAPILSGFNKTNLGYMIMLLDKGNAGYTIQNSSFISSWNLEFDVTSINRGHPLNRSTMSLVYGFMKDISNADVRTRLNCLTSDCHVKITYNGSTIEVRVDNNIVDTQTFQPDSSFRNIVFGVNGVKDDKIYFDNVKFMR